MSSRWSDHCASPCKAPIRKPARRGSIVTESNLSQELMTQLVDDSSVDGVDSMIFYVQNRWMQGLQPDENTTNHLSKPMRRLSLAKDAQPKVNIPVAGNGHGLERQSPWASTA